MSALTMVQALVNPILKENCPDASIYVAGGAVRDLVYTIKPCFSQKPKDIDLFIVNLPDNKDEKLDIFRQILAVTSGKWAAYPAPEEGVNKDRILVAKVNVLDDIGIEIIEGREDIEKTVAAFDWYECAWYLPTTDSAKALRPHIDKVVELQEMDYTPKLERDTLTLLKYHHAAKSLVRGFKFMQRHGFQMNALDCQVLATEVRLQEEKYGQYLHI
jgi:hypothetical protein